MLHRINTTDDHSLSRSRTKKDDLETKSHATNGDVSGTAVPTLEENISPILQSTMPKATNAGMEVVEAEGQVSENLARITNESTTSSDIVQEAGPKIDTKILERHGDETEVSLDVPSISHKSMAISSLINNPLGITDEASDESPREIEASPSPMALSTILNDPFRKALTDDFASRDADTYQESNSATGSEEAETLNTTNHEPAAAKHETAQMPIILTGIEVSQNGKEDVYEISPTSNNNLPAESIPQPPEEERESFIDPYKHETTLMLSILTDQEDPIKDQERTPEINAKDDATKVDEYKDLGHASQVATTSLTPSVSLEESITQMPAEEMEDINQEPLAHDSNSTPPKDIAFLSKHEINIVPDDTAGDCLSREDDGMPPHEDRAQQRHDQDPLPISVVEESTSFSVPHTESTASITRPMYRPEVSQSSRSASIPPENSNPLNHFAAAPIPRVTFSLNSAPSSPRHRRKKRKASSTSSALVSIPTNIPSIPLLSTASEDSISSDLSPTPARPIKFKLKYSGAQTSESPTKRQRPSQSQKIPQPEVFDCIEVRLDFENVSLAVKAC